MLSADEGQRVGIFTREQAQNLLPEPVDDDLYAYESILDDCMKLIKKSSEHNQEYCLFVVPPMSFKLPSYDADKIFDRLYLQLDELGYALYTWRKQRRVLISWYRNRQIETTEMSKIIKSVYEADKEMENE